ncbi:MAG: hypothetical protein ACYSSI_04690 [Planctomycetota bacterium]|jgi:hypothetical protein
MQTKIYMILSLSTVILTFLGCNTNRVSLVKQGQVLVAKQPSEKIDILWTDVYQQNGQTWVYGVLKQRALNSSAIKTHVDIQVLNPDGSIQYETVTEDLFVPCHRVGKSPNWKKFRVQLPDELLKDSQISMMVHSNSHGQRDNKL